MELIGGKELDNALQELERKLARKIGVQALRAGAKIILAKARANAPVKSGALKAAIKIRAGRSRKGERRVRVIVGDKWFTGDEFYAAFVEFGHKSGKRSGGVTALAKRIARSLRGQSRAARATGGGLAAKGTAFRERQEKFFRAEGYRQSIGQERKQIAGKHFIERAFESEKEKAVKAIVDSLKQKLITDKGQG